VRAGFDAESAVSAAATFGDAVSDAAEAVPEFASAAAEAVFGADVDAADAELAEFCAAALFAAGVTRCWGAMLEADGPVGWFPAAGPGFCGSAANSKGPRPPDPGLDEALLGGCA
jgi:hypothetical protein